MISRQRQYLNQREKRALIRILLAASTLVLLFLFFAPDCGFRSYRAIKEKSSLQMQENAHLLQETQQLQKEIRRIQHDDHYLEQIAREKYGMLRKNEEVYYTSPPIEEKNDGR